MNHTGKRTDLRATNTQNIVSKVGSILAKCMDTLLTAVTKSRPKPDGTHHMILNLKKLNESVVYQHFKMDTLWTIVRMMKPNCYVASIDIKDAYCSVPKFEWYDTVYMFSCFPNGLALCPRKFIKLLKPVYCYL